MALLLIVVLVLVLVGLLVRSGRFTRPPAEQGRWWDQPAADPVLHIITDGDVPPGENGHPG